MPTRRKFIQQSSGFALGLGLVGLNACTNSTSNLQDETDNLSEETPPLFFQISLAQWSLHKAFFDGKLDHLDFAATAKKEFNINAIEYVNQFFKDKAKDKTYLAEMNQRANDNGVKNLLIMIDEEGGLAELDNKVRTEAIENH